MNIGRLATSLIRNDAPSLLVVGRLGATALALLSAPIVARALGPEGRGQAAATIAIYLILPIVLASGIPLEVRRLAATNGGAAVLRAGRVLCALSAFPSMLVAATLFMSIFSKFPGNARLIASLGVALAPLSISWMCDLSVLIAHERYRAVLVLQVLQPASYAALIITTWWLGIANLSLVLLANIVATVVTFFGGFVLTRGSPRSGVFSINGLLRGGLKFAGSAISEVGTNRLDQVLILPLLGAYQAGIYSVAVTVASIPLALGHALAASYFSPIANASGAGRDELKAQAARSGLAIGLLTYPLFAVVSWLGIPLVFGSEYSAAVPVAMVSLFGSIAMVAAFLYSMALAAEGRGLQMSLAQASALVSAVILLFYFAPRYGAIGAAMASSASYFVLLGALIAYFDIPIARVIPRPNDFADCISRLFSGPHKATPNTPPS